MQTGDWLVSKDPRMKPKLAALQAMFPQITMTVLQERLAAAEGHLPNAVKVTFLPTGCTLHTGYACSNVPTCIMSRLILSKRCKFCPK